jgi:hypothetical protein
MAKKPTILPDDQIVTAVSAKSNESVGWYDSKLAKERERVIKYYNGQLPARQHEGSSTYVSTDVYDATEMMKAQLLETFAGGDEIAQFDPDLDMNVEQCRVATEYASYVIFRENDGFGIFRDVIHDGLTARAGVAKVYWEECYTYSEEKFEGLSYDDAFALASQDDVDEFDATEGPMGFSGSLTRKKDVSRIRIDAVAPEEFLISKTAVSIEKADYVGQRTLKTRDELLKMGIEERKLRDVSFGDEDGEANQGDTQARRTPIMDDVTDTPAQDELQRVYLFENYMRLQIDRSKGVRMYRVLIAGNKLLDYEEVDKAPFLAYVPLPVPHIFYGNNFAARVIPTQNARTVLVRGVLDHTAITTNPRWQVVSGGLLNPREMLENRLGGLVNVRRPDSIAPLPQNNLNPFVYETLGLLRDDKEQTTGVSGLTSGLNKDALSKQNSSALVDSMVSLASQRQKVAARNFAYGFFVPLMIEVIRLAILHVQKEAVIEVAGEPLNVDPRLWSERKTATVSMHLGYGEKDQMTSKLSMTYDKLASDPAIAPMFTVENRYELIRDTMKMAGITRAPAYITHPSKVQPAQPDPHKEKELAIKDKLAEAAVANAQANISKNQKGLVIDSQRVENDRAKLALEAENMQRTNDRQDLETASKIDVEQREITLAENAPDEQTQVIANP